MSWFSSPIIWAHYIYIYIDIIYILLYYRIPGIYIYYIILYYNIVYTCVYIYIYIYIDTRSTAQGGGGSFKNRKPKKERLVVVNQGWQSEATDGLKGA